MVVEIGNTAHARLKSVSGTGREGRRKQSGNEQIKRKLKRLWRQATQRQQEKRDAGRETNRSGREQVECKVMVNRGAELYDGHRDAGKREGKCRGFWWRMVSGADSGQSGRCL